MSRDTGHVSIACWNVHGIKTRTRNKLDDALFINEINQHQIIGLVETHSTDTNDIHCEKYYTVQVNRPRSGKKEHGGIAILVHNSIKKGVKFHYSESPDLVWVQLQKQYFHLEDDIFLAIVYIPPTNSTYSKKQNMDPFELLEKDITKYSA
jgi:exonuclease III